MPPTDGVDLMPYLSGRKGPAERPHLVLLHWPGSLEKMTGIEEFSDSGLMRGLVHLAYVQG